MNILKARTHQDRLADNARKHAEPHNGLERSYSAIIEHYTAQLMSTPTERPLEREVSRRPRPRDEPNVSRETL
ncbi:MAG: hypothetical protein R3284_05855 [Rubricoccaceae bacterium]|nr:hypothetical protein [Rubricoccaceae bacterium]